MSPKKSSVSSMPKAPAVTKSTTPRAAEVEDSDDDSGSEDDGIHTSSKPAASSNPRRGGKAKDLPPVGLVELETQSSVFFRGTKFEEKVRCPKHDSWSREKGLKNKYKLYYYPGEGRKIKVFDAATAGRMPADMAGLRLATHLVFEPQQLADLLQHAAVVVVAAAAAGGRRPGEARSPPLPEALARAFGDAAVEVVPGGGGGGGGKRRALDYLGAALPARAPHLVYLHAGVARTKAVYFGRRVPRRLGSAHVHEAGAAEVLALVRRTLLVARFLRDPRVVDIYRGIALYVRETWVAVGKAFAKNDGVDPRLRGAGIAWDVVYDKWEEEFLDQVAQNMNACIVRGIRRLGEVSKSGQKTAREWLDGKPVDLSHLKRQKQDTPASVMVEWKTQLRDVLMMGQQATEEKKKKAVYETKGKKKTEERKEAKKKSESKGKAASGSSVKKSTTVKASTGAKAVTEKKVSTTKKSSPGARVSTGDKISTGKKLTKDAKLPVRTKVSAEMKASTGETSKSTGKKVSAGEKVSTAKKLQKRRECLLDGGHEDLTIM